MKLWNFETLKLWHYETLKLWTSDIMKLWNFETLILWTSETLKLWNSESLTLWNYETLTNLWNFETLKLLWNSETLKLWTSDIMKHWNFCWWWFKIYCPHGFIMEKGSPMHVNLTRGPNPVLLRWKLFVFLLKCRDTLPSLRGNSLWILSAFEIFAGYFSEKFQ